MKICFDLDGTLASLYSVPNWLECLRAEDTTPYEIADTMVNMNVLARRLNTLQRKGNKIVIISWLAKCGSADYDKAVTNAKMRWLGKHLASVRFDEIHIVKYGVPKEQFADCVDDILFDDEEKNRENWIGKAYDVDNILEVLKNLPL